jgi:3-oxoadipate enol-lactonase
LQVVKANGVTLHYRTVGDFRSRPAMVFVNSLGTDFRIWDEVVALLSRDFAMLLYDFRGHGLSEQGAAPYRMEDHAADLAALMDALGIREAVVCGVSIGGVIAQALYARAPQRVRALVLSDTAHKIGDAAFWNARIAAIRAGGIESIADTIMERWFSREFRRSSPAFSAYRTMLCRQDVEGYIASCTALREADFTAAAGRIKIPAICVVGDQDGSTPAALVQIFATLIPGARCEIIAGAGHLPCIEQPAAFAALVRTFVAGLETESRYHVSH